MPALGYTGDADTTATTNSYIVDASNTVWRTWASDTTTCTCTDSTDTVWIHWAANAYTPTITANDAELDQTTWHVWSGDVERRKRQRRRERETERRFERQRRKQRRKQLVAERTAEDLLTAHLDDEQRADWEKDRKFTVWSRDRKRQYVVHGNSKSGNIRRVIDGEEVTQYCAHPARPIPLPDHLLAQKLHLEDNDIEFIGVANVHWDRRSDEQKARDREMAA